MGVTVKVFMCVFGLMLMTKIHEAYSENELSNRRDKETPCVWQCPLILERCLWEGRGISPCTRIAKICARLCAGERANTKRGSIISARQCKQECYGMFQQCSTITTTPDDHNMCVRANSHCMKDCGE